MPPYYGVESLDAKIEKIENIANKIYELTVEAGEYVKEVKEEIKKLNTVKD